MLGLAPILGFFSLCWLATADSNVTAEDNEIIWPTSGWSPTATVCSPEGQAHFAFKNNVSISYEFTGTAIYMGILRSDITGTYTVTVDNDTPALFDGYHTTAICDIQFSQIGLSFGPHIVTAKLFGISPQITNPNPSVDNYLEIDAFTYTIPGPNSSLPSSSSAGPSSTMIAPSTISSRSSLKAPAIAGIVVAVIGSLAAVIAFFFLHRRNKRLSVKCPETVLDRDSVHTGRLLPQSTPPLDSNHVHQMNVSSDVPLTHTSAPWLHSAQQSQSTTGSEFPRQDLAKEVAVLISSENQRSEGVRNGEAPPMYNPEP